jgi:triacylglycerol lipase
MSSAPAPAQDINNARHQAMTSDFFALCYLMLCQLGYADENSGDKAVTQIKTLLPTMPVPSGTVAGKWQLGWGPRVPQDNSNSNLMYAAEFVTTAGQPVFSVIVIRGTDTQAKPSGIVVQLVEDIGASTQVPFPAGNTAGAKIAIGTKIGLDILNGFTDSTGRTVKQYAADFANANPGAPIVVTGHSLGGCQATVMAMDLSATVASTKIVPTTFAAPSAGNQAFIDLYQQKFPFCPRWFNTFDLVPNAFSTLDQIKQLWGQCHRPAPEALKLILDAFEVLLAFLKISYAQQPLNSSRQLAGVCQPPSTSLISKVSPDQIAAEIKQSLRDIAPHLNLHVSLPDFLFLGIIDWVKELLFQHLILTGYWNAVQSSSGVATIRNPFTQAAGATA